MTNRAHTFFSQETDSLQAGRRAGENLVRQFAGERLEAVLVYATINHQQPQVLRGLRAALGPQIPIVGCSAQGVVADAELTEAGFALAAMGLGGQQLRCAVAVEHEFQNETRDKGGALGRRLRQQLGGEPKLVVLLYDPLCGADVEALLAGLRRQVDCPIVGGAASQPWGPLVQTFQYADDQVFSHGVVALGLSGPFHTAIGMCDGTAPTGIGVTVTRARGPMVLEIDGRQAVDVWRQATGCERSEVVNQDHNAAWALGVERRYSVGGVEQVARMMRCAFGFDLDAGGVIFQAPIPEGTRVMFCHRTEKNVLRGSEEMADGLRARLAGRTPWAVLGFECGARTYPFLGQASTLAEHATVRQIVAPQAPWLGMMAWGEIGPCGGEPGFHNFTYPLVLLVEDEVEPAAA
jgi:hypothetical protein